MIYIPFKEQLQLLVDAYADAKRKLYENATGPRYLKSEETMKAVLDFVPDPDLHRVEEIQHEMRSRINLILAEAEDGTELDRDDAIDGLVGYVLILAGKVNMKDA